MVRLTLLVDESEHDRLRLEAARRGVSKAAVVRGLLRDHFPDPPIEPMPQWKARLREIDVEPLNVSVDEYLYGPV